MSIDLTGLVVSTAHVSYAGPRRLDLTLRSKHQVGIAFAAPWAFVEPWRDALRIARERWDSAAEDARISIGIRGVAGPEEARIIRASAAERIEEQLAAAWATFAAGYEVYVERSRGIRMDAWTELGTWAAEGRAIVGVCDCAGKQAAPPRRRCHRFLWATHLAGMGARYAGEIAEQGRPVAGARRHG